MPRTDSREPADEEVKDLFERMFRVILKDVVRKVCASLGRYLDQADIDDFTQRIGFLLLDNDYRLLRSFKYESELETWLFTIAKRHILRCLREQERIESLENKLLDSFIVPQHQEEKALLKERKKILHAAFRKLPERKQKLLGLWLQEQKRKETAEEMEIKTKSVSVEKAVLIKMLQRIIRDDYAI